MNALNIPYNASVIVDRLTITVTECSVSDEERHLELKIDGSRVGEVRLLPYYRPRIAVSASHLALWGGTRLYIASLTDDALCRFDLEDEVHAAYPVGDRWCLVCETSVVLFDSLNGIEVAHYYHDEILLESWWSGDRLVVEDLQGRRLGFRPQAAGYEIEPEPVE